MTNLFYGNEIGTQEAAETLRILQLFYGHKNWDYQQFADFKLSDETIQYAREQIAKLVNNGRVV